MHFNIRGDRLEVTESIRNYIEEKLSRLNKYFENPEELTGTIVVRTRGIAQIIEVTIPMKRIVLRGEEEHSDLYAAIDKVADKLERQIRKNKTRMKNRKSEVVDLFIDFEEDKDDVEENKIVKRKSVENKPMSEEEAILQMNLIDHEFFIFENVETSKMSVLYKRKDGNYGLIEIK